MNEISKKNANSIIDSLMLSYLSDDPFPNVFEYFSQDGSVIKITIMTNSFDCLFFKLNKGAQMQICESP